MECDHRLCVNCVGSHFKTLIEAAKVDENQLVREGERIRDERDERDERRDEVTKSQYVDRPTTRVVCVCVVLCGSARVSCTDSPRTTTLMVTSPPSSGVPLRGP